jgi:uncharacterized protein YpbB
VFEFGQGYVAISRVKRLSGVYILGYNDMAFRVDPDVLQKDKEFCAQSENAEKVFSRFSADEFERLKNEFIIASDGELVASETPKNKKKISTYDETFAFWKEGKTIIQIAQTRNLSEKTILNHVEKLFVEKKIKREDIMRILSPDVLKNLSKIKNAFKSLDTDRLTPVFEYFKSKYTYEQLKLARIIMD